MSRKRKLQVSEVVEVLRETHGCVYPAAKRLRIDPSTLYEYIKAYPLIREALAEERGHLLDIGELALKRAVERGEGWAIAFLLRTLGKSRGYTELKDVEITDRRSLVAEVLQTLTGDERESPVERPKEWKN